MSKLLPLAAGLAVALVLPMNAQAQQVHVSGQWETQEFSSSASYAYAGFPGQIIQASQALLERSVSVQGPAPSRTLRLNDRGQDVAWLDQALSAHGYPPNPDLPAAPEQVHEITFDQQDLVEPAVIESDPVFDEDMEARVRAFQASRNIKSDGVAGSSTYSRLLEDQSRLGRAGIAWAHNIARWADEARAAGHDRMIVVNIPSFTLHAINLHNNEVELTSRVIVGKTGGRTPLMLTHMINLKANPDWTPPPSARGKRYQRPGPNNALGLMRFSLDNNRNIYLHDTNARNLFANDYRALSLGCVRVQQWKPLAAWAARQDEQWVEDVALAGGKTRFLPVDKTPVVLTYSRVDLVDEQLLQFDDVYGRGARAIGYAELNGGQAPTWPWTQQAQ